MLGVEVRLQKDMGSWGTNHDTNSTCLSEAKPRSLTSQPVSKPFRSTSDQLGSSAYFLFSLMGSHMFSFYIQMSLYLMLSIFPCLCFDL